MDNEIFPRYYDAWKVCITQKCNISLTKEYVVKRIDDLSDVNSTSTKLFTEKYGAHWRDRILGYFKQALNDPDLK